MSGISTPSWPVAIASVVIILNISWIHFLMYDANRLSNCPSRPSLLESLGLICHVILSAFLPSTVIISGEHCDPALIWFEALLAFRYWRTLTGI